MISEMSMTGGLISVDSYGWIQALNQRTQRLSSTTRAIEKAAPSEIVAWAMVLYEVYKKIRQAVNEQSALEAVAAIGQTLVVPVDQSLCLQGAADYSLMFGLHMADAIVYATACHYGAELYTSVEDLKGVKGVVFI